MASSGTIDKDLTGWLKLRIKWVVNSQSIENNSSNITATVQLITGNGNLQISSRNIDLTINGTKYSGSSTLTVSNNTTKNLFSKTVNVSHNSDGSKTVSLSATISFNATISGSTWNDKSVSGSATLNTIPRTSSFTRSGTAQIGSEQTIAITRASSSFTHTLKYVWAGETKTIATKISTSYKWTPPVSMAAKIPNATSGACKLICETYSGTTLIGSKELSFTLSVPASVVPSVSSIALVEAVSGLYDKFGGFVDKKSKIKFEVEAEGAQGSTIKTYSVNIAGQKFSKSSGTTAVIDTGAGTKKIMVTVTDSRGRKASLETTFNVIAYSPPTFTNIAVNRCNADGTLNDEGTCLSFTVSVKISAVNNKNTAAYALAYKLATASNYTSLPLEASGYTYNDTVVFTTPTFSVDSSYNIRFQATDYFETITKTLDLSTGKPVYDVKSNKKGFAFFKVAELDDVLDIGSKTRFFGGLMSMILKSGADFNDIKTPNIYASETTFESGNYINAPLSTATTFMLEVQQVGSSIQLRQIVTTCSKNYSRTYERFYYGDAWGDWVCSSDFDGVLLWSGSYYMNASQTISLSSPVSAQRSGIVLIFSRYVDGAVQKHNSNHFFVPKRFVRACEGEGSCFRMNTVDFKYITAKYLYISDTQIKGNDNNQAEGTANGVTYNNKAYVLRFVIGV